MHKISLSLSLFLFSDCVGVFNCTPALCATSVLPSVAHRCGGSCNGTSRSAPEFGDALSAGGGSTKVTLALGLAGLALHALAILICAAMWAFPVPVFPGERRRFEVSILGLLVLAKMFLLAAFVIALFVVQHVFLRDLPSEVFTAVSALIGLPVLLFGLDSLCSLYDLPRDCAKPKRRNYGALVPTEQVAQAAFSRSPIG